ncbi:hypothetical protein ENUP19_0038G0058 [Entamoeba nuttalli]|uniref:Importin alpha subunit, putative n=2 Tax=Entamoeba nuttalli TaxID=412467 RepID=K2GZS1_ENTNP|nr:importin alpha subunit, putative [Entamoeba nuttalli P19]EKE39477.1 importin alpha subunit, putative [Entamoeba nuttalli P19]|eukprot:XP_008858182.1 importin alpha subunit, putative [Entamoeba nuttalli P19]
MSNIRFDFINENKEARQKERSQLRTSRRVQSLAKRRTEYQSQVQEESKMEEGDEDDFLVRGTGKLQRQKQTIESPSARRQHTRSISYFANSLVESQNIPERVKELLEQLFQGIKLNGYTSYKVIESTGIIPVLVNFINHPNSSISALSLEIINLLLLESSDFVTGFINEKIVYALSHKIETAPTELRITIVTLIGNIAGDRAETRDYLLGENVVNLIQKLVSMYNNVTPMKERLMFLISNLCRSQPFVDLEKVQMLLPYIFSSIKQKTFDKIMADALWGFSFIVSNPQNICKFQDFELLETILSCLSTTNNDIIGAILAVLVSYIDNDISCANWLIEHNVINHLNTIIHSQCNSKTKVHAAFVLSELVLIPNTKVVPTLISNVFVDLPPLISSNYNDFEFKKEIGWLVTNCILSIKSPKDLLTLLSIKDFYLMFMLFFDDDNTKFITQLLSCVFVLSEFDQKTNFCHHIIDNLQERNLDNILSSFELSKFSSNSLVLEQLNKIKKSMKYVTSSLF